MQSLRTIITLLAIGGAPFFPAAARAESLPMPASHYADLCQQSGGAATTHLSSGIGTVECAWSDQGRTECKVGDNQVTVCGINCESNACLKANPARYSPVWPLTGGPKSAPLAPAN
jgi:hypothetical protein